MGSTRYHSDGSMTVTTSDGETFEVDPGDNPAADSGLRGMQAQRAVAAVRKARDTAAAAPAAEVRSADGPAEAAEPEQRERYVHPSEEQRQRLESGDVHSTAGAQAIRNAGTAASSDGSLRSLVKATLSVRSNELTYRRNGRESYFLDSLRLATNNDASGEARARLARHAKEIDTELRGAVEYRDLNRTDGQGGFFTPPMWLMSQWVEFARPGRAIADACSVQALPGGTDSINVPKIATGTATAIQTSDGAAVQETDLTDTSVQANVKTIAGQQSIALQLLEQSPVNFDDVVFRDLVSSYNQQLDLQVINGSGASGQMLGILGTSGIQSLAYSDTTQAAGTLYAALANAIQLVHTGRYAPPTVIAMHPRRWAALLASRDTTGRPLFLPDAEAGRSLMGSQGAVASQGVVGVVQGLPVVVDANLPTNLGAGTNQDTILVMRASDLILFESGIRTRTLLEVKGQNLEAVLQVYNYCAFTAARYPASIVQISGAGLSTPSYT